MNDDWDNWRAHVLSELKRANDNFAVVAASVTNLHIEIAKLQVKSGVWGIIGGMIPVIIVIFLDRIK